MTALLLWTLLSGSVAWAQPAACPAPTTPAQVLAELDAAEAAFGSMDLAGFQAHQQAALAALECVGQGLLPADAAAVHRVAALGAFLAEDRAGTVAAYRAVASIEPGWTLSDELAPAGHPLREQLETARVLPPSPTESLEPREGLELRLDGRTSLSRPTDQPVVLQALDDRGGIVLTDWLAAGEEVPEELLVGEEEGGQARAPRQRSGGGPRLALLVPTAVVGAGAGATYALAWSSRATYLDEGTPYAELEGIRGRTNALSTTSAVLGGLGLGLATATVLTWEW